MKGQQVSPKYTGITSESLLPGSQQFMYGDDRPKAVWRVHLNHQETKFEEYYSYSLLSMAVESLAPK